MYYLEQIINKTVYCNHALTHYGFSPFFMHGFFRQADIVFIFAKVLCVLLFAVFAVRAERLPVKVYTSDDGLGSSASFNLVHDAHGSIWLCSYDGLMVFDGKRFRHYTTKNELATNLIHSFAEDNEGYIRVVTYGELYPNKSKTKGTDLRLKKS
jgi:hypothetical protein